MAFGRRGKMRHRRFASWWLSLLAVFLLCSAIGFTVLTSGCGKLRKKEMAEFEAGKEWLEDMRDRIEKTISDPDKTRRMLFLVDQAERDLRELDQVVLGFYRDLAGVDSDYNSTRQDLQRVFDEWNAKRREFRDRFTETRFKMRDMVTPEEWKKLTRVRKGLAQQWQRYPGQ
jgi:hypothetical protein